MFGYKNHIGIDRAHGLIRTRDASAANAHDGARLPDVVSKVNTGSGVWADTAYRSKQNAAFLTKGMFTSHTYQKKPPRRPMPERIASANAKRSAVRSAVEHVFTGQKHRMGTIVRTIGIARARMTKRRRLKSVPPRKSTNLPPAIGAQHPPVRLHIAVMSKSNGSFSMYPDIIATHSH